MCIRDSCTITLVTFLFLDGIFRSSNQIKEHSLTSDLKPRSIKLDNWGPNYEQKKVKKIATFSKFVLFSPIYRLQIMLEGIFFFFQIVENNVYNKKGFLYLFPIWSQSGPIFRNTVTWQNFFWKKFYDKKIFMSKHIFKYVVEKKNDFFIFWLSVYLWYKCCNLILKKVNWKFF